MFKVWVSRILGWWGQRRSAYQIALARVNGRTLRVAAHAQKNLQGDCNHIKGGRVEFVNQGKTIIFPTKGDEFKKWRSVIKHRLANGDWWIRCHRCGKTWTNPVRSSYSRTDFIKVKREYETAVLFETNNAPSSSIQFRFKDDGKRHRSLVAGA